MYKSVVEGKGGIVARIVADSVSETGKRITTFELEYHRFIHSEIMTHRLFSRNAMSSRAVPVKKMIEQVRNNPATPIHWGANQQGMQAENECTTLVKIDEQSSHAAKVAWMVSAHKAADMAERFADAGYHKQIVNRLLEPFQMMKTVLTSTEFDNFFWLRCHKDAQPEIKELADCMYKAMQESEPEALTNGEWHTPYVQHKRDGDGELRYFTEGCDLGNDPETALRVSASCCAQVSYRVLDNSLEKALDIYDKLVKSKPVHASPFEHQATPVSNDIDGLYWDDWNSTEGVTHQDSSGNLWSANFKGWIQHRQLIEDNVKSLDE
jgi:thymidylate synthase ThyX